jgi:hypothetical protein
LSLDSSVGIRAENVKLEPRNTKCRER